MISISKIYNVNETGKQLVIDQPRLLIKEECIAEHQAKRAKSLACVSATGLTNYASICNL